MLSGKCLRLLLQVYPPILQSTAVNVTPDGRAPVSLSVGAGEPVAVTVKVPATPSEKAMLLALENAGAVPLFPPPPPPPQPLTTVQIITANKR